jgi:hypothetical protein
MKKNKKKLICVSIMMCFGLNAQDNSQMKNFEEKEYNPMRCKHNALHFATSVEDLSYVSKLLDLSVFNIKDLNKQCQNALNIASELGNVELLRILSKYLDSYEIYNGLGESPLQTAIKHQQPESVLFFIENGIDPNTKNKNGLNAFDYQNEYGTDLTLKILQDYKSNRKNIKLEEKSSEDNEDLLNLKINLKEKEDKLKDLELLVKNNPSMIENIKGLRENIESLQIIIKSLQSIIEKQKLEINNYKNNKNNLSEEAELNKINKNKDSLESHIEDNGVILTKAPKILENELVLSDISNDGEVLNNASKIFDILSKPIYTIEKK